MATLLDLARRRDQVVKTHREDQEKTKEGTMRGKQKREKGLGRG